MVGSYFSWPGPCFRLDHISRHCSHLLKYSGPQMFASMCLPVCLCTQQEMVGKQQSENGEKSPTLTSMILKDLESHCSEKG